MLPTPLQEEIGEDVATEGFNAGEVIIEHVANSGLDHPLIHFPLAPFGIDFSVTKHVLMLWIVALVVFVTITFSIRRYLKQNRPIPTGFINALEAIVVFIRDNIVEPNVGKKWVNTWTPLLLTLFVFILTANVIGLIPIFDVLGLLHWILAHTVLNSVDEGFAAQLFGEEGIVTLLLHGGTTATANFNVTAGLATITFFAIIAAGTMAHGFVQHWKNLVPSGLAKPIYIILIPIEFMSLFVRPFALTMRLAANMTGGHIAILAIFSFVFIFTELSENALVGIGIGAFVAVPMAVAISALEIIVVLVQAYVFTLLSAVFIGMAIHAHH